MLGSPIGSGSDGVTIRFPGDTPQFLYLIEERDRIRPRSRTRLWLSPLQASLAEEVERLTALGATVIERRWRHKELGLGVVTLADPKATISVSSPVIARLQRPRKLWKRIDSRCGWRKLPASRNICEDQPHHSVLAWEWTTLLPA